MVADLMPVVGVRLVEGRSGSTLLMQLLGTSDAIVFDTRYPAEYRWLSYMARMAAQMCEPFQHGHHPGVTEFFFDDGPTWGPVPFQSDVVDSRDLRAPLLRAMWRAWTASALGGRPTSRFYAEKLAVDIDDVTGAGIPLKVIDLVRDPRDMLASIRAFTRDGMPGFGRRPGMSEKEYLERFASVARTAMQRAAAPASERDRIVVRYEDLVSDLTTQAERIGEWLGIGLDAKAVEAQGDAYRHHMTARSPAESVGRWRTDLTSGDIEYLHRACRRGWPTRVHVLIGVGAP